MRPVTAAFLKGVGSSHAMASRATVVAPGQHGVTPTGTPVPIGSASMTFDSTRQVLGAGSLTTSQNWPASLTDLLTPFGNEVFLERGLVHGGGSVEWVSLGYFRINQAQQQDAPSGAVDLEFSDRMQNVVDARIPIPLTFAAGSTITSIIESLVTDCYTGATFDIDTSLATATTNAAQTTADDRYGFIDNLVTSYGMIWYWDYRGVLVVKPPPDPDTPLVTLKSGRDGVLVRQTVARTLGRDGVYSGCVASGQQATDAAPPTALIVDNNPNSPTYWYGNFGKIPQFFSSSFLQTEPQCETAATSIMLKSTGVSYEVDFGMVPNPALEVWDPVAVQLPNLLETHVIKQIQIGLAASDPMTAQTKQLVGGIFSAV
jgi:hypothetical protein